MHTQNLSATIHDYDPAKGLAFQGDVSIIPIPKNIKIDRSDEITPVNGRLILQEGEVSGHHHAITLMERSSPHDKIIEEAKKQRSEKLATSSGTEHAVIDGVYTATIDILLKDAQAGKIAVPTARLYRDPAAVEAMRVAGIITRVDLAVAVLVVETGPMCLSHEEHDTIRIPPGEYLIGRQIESAGAEERVIAD